MRQSHLVELIAPKRSRKRRRMAFCSSLLSPCGRSVENKVGRQSGQNPPSHVFQQRLVKKEVVVAWWQESTAEALLPWHTTQESPVADSAGRVPH